MDLEGLLRNYETGTAKLFLIYQALKARNQNRAFFWEGTYVPLEIGGKFGRHVLAFYRQLDNSFALTVVPRFLVDLPKMGEMPWRIDWQDTQVQLPDGSPTEWTDVFSGAEPVTTNGRLDVGQVLDVFPVGLLLAGDAVAG
jgi:(1->4)-alpha-D-glucan 1-alpha-D-glucosylmutase